jgi:hypothetical protein
LWGLRRLLKAVLFPALLGKIVTSTAKICLDEPSRTGRVDRSNLDLAIRKRISMLAPRTRSFLAIIFVLYSSRDADAANFATLEVPGATCTSASKINNRDQIVGWYCNTDGGIQSFLWQKGKFVILDGVPGGVNSAAGINNHGDIVGSYVDNQGLARGYLLQDDVFTSIEFPGATETSVTDISDDGQIIGNYVDTGGALRGFLLAEGSYTSIDIPNADFVQVLGLGGSGRLVGFYVDRELVGHGFLWEQSIVTTFDHPNASFNTALHDMNSRDDVVGFQDGLEGNSFAVRGDRIRPLKLPSFALDARVTGINDQRQMVGEYFDETGRFFGFFWRRPAYGRNPRPGDVTRQLETQSLAHDNRRSRVPTKLPWFLELP